MNPLHQIAMKRTLSRLNPCLAEGEGVHKWIYYAACRLVEAGYSDEDALDIIEEMMTRDPDPGSEIEDALESARRKCSPGVYFDCTIGTK